MLFIGSPGPLELLVLAVMGLIIVGGLILLVALLANEKTRMVGVVLLLLVALLAIGVVGAGAFFFMQIQSDIEILSRGMQW